MKKLILSTILLLSFGILAFAQTEDERCPNLEMIAPFHITMPGQDMFFSISSNEISKKYKPEYKWNVSAGKIIEGQGSSIIRVSTNGLDGQNVTATIFIKDLPEKCQNILSETGGVASLPIIEPLERYGKLSTTEEFVRLKIFTINLKDNLKYKGYILFEIEKTEKLSAVKYRLSNIFEFFKRLGIKRERILLDICKTEYNQTTLFMLFDEAEIPKVKESECIDINLK